MECLKKPVWTDYTGAELKKISVDAPDEEARKQVLRNWDSIAKPLDGLGKFETLTAKIGAATGSDELNLSRKAVIIMCADNGIVEEGVSQSGQEVTTLVAKEMAAHESSVGKMAAQAGADTIPVDIGINSGEQIEGVIPKKIRRGTRNFLREPAMTEEETVRAIAAGIDMVSVCRDMKYGILATGEMGIGNTTTSSAVTAALLHCEPELVTGRGAGLTDAKLLKKQQVIRQAIGQYDLYHADPLRILQTVGGLDIAGLAGVCIGGALYHVPVVLDGVISMASALIAERLMPGTREYLIPSHMGKEPASKLLSRELGLEPVITADLALGEGTGAVMMFALLDLALSVYRGRTTFSDIQMDAYERYDTI